MTNHSEAAKARLEYLQASLANADYAAAIVDLEGWNSQDATGRFRKIKADNYQQRYEIRSLAHVHSYKFAVVEYNAKAKAILAKEG
jgi:hypothetical protein